MNLKQFREKTVGTVVRLLPRPTFKGEPIRNEHNAWLVIDEVREAVFLLQNRTTQHEVEMGADNIQEFRTPNLLILRGQLVLKEKGQTEFEPSAPGLVGEEVLEALNHERKLEQERGERLASKVADEYVDMTRRHYDQGPTALARLGLESLGSDRLIRLAIHEMKVRSGTDPWGGQERHIQDLDLVSFFRYIRENQLSFFSHSVEDVAVRARASCAIKLDNTAG